VVKSVLLIDRDEFCFTREEEAFEMSRENSTASLSNASHPRSGSVASERSWPIGPEQFALWWSTLIFVVNTIALLYFHFGLSWVKIDPLEGGEVHMNRIWMQRILSLNETTRTSVQNDNPLYWKTFDPSTSYLQMRWLNPTYIDMILFSALIVMAFELLDFITKHIGSTSSCRMDVIHSRRVQLTPCPLCRFSQSGSR
jgi:hypothetical protein